MYRFQKLMFSHMFPNTSRRNATLLPFYSPHFVLRCGEYVLMQSVMLRLKLAPSRSRNGEVVTIHTIPDTLGSK